MVNCLKETTHKWMTFIGGFVMLLPNGITWYWGNMSIYIYSYFHHKNKTNPRHVKSPWLLSLYVVSWSIALMLSGYVNKRIGQRLSLTLGIALFNGGLVASYFVFEESLTLLDLTMGVISGFGCGIIHGMVLQTVVEWIVGHIGLTTAFIFTSYAVGSVMTNQIITHYLNPDNKKVNVHIGETHFFSQEDILDRVPNIFIVLFVCSGVLHAVGFLLIRIKQVKITGCDIAEKNLKVRSLSVLSQVPVLKAEIVTSVQDNSDNQNEFLIDSGSYSFDHLKTRSKSLVGNNTPRNAHIEDTCEKSPSEVLKSMTFYVLWITMLGSDSGYMCLCNYYKIFGQVWIKDDHFLTNLGTTLALATVGMRLFWGFLTDVIGVKLTLVCLTSGVSLISTFYFFTAPVNRWLFFMATVGFAAINSGMYTNFVVAVHSLYGKKNFTSNCGLVTSSTIFLNLIFPSAAQLLLSNFGWFSLFFTVGLINFGCMVLIMCALPR